MLGVVGGYVLPRGAADASVSSGYKHCREEVKARLAAVVRPTSADVASQRMAAAGRFLPHAVLDGAGSASSRSGWRDRCALVSAHAGLGLDCRWSASAMPAAWPSSASTPTHYPCHPAFHNGTLALDLPPFLVPPPGATWSSPSAELAMLGYGNFAVRINDPRVQPRTWLPDSDMDAEESVAAMVNCMVGELRGTITAWWVSCVAR